MNKNYPFQVTTNMGSKLIADRIIWADTAMSATMKAHHLIMGSLEHQAVAKDPTTYCTNCGCLIAKDAAERICKCQTPRPRL